MEDGRWNRLGLVSYDPDLDLIYYGTANPGPWNPELRPGDNKWIAGIFARDPDTGLARWFYQWSPHDLYDHDGVNENVLLDLQMPGGTRKVLVLPTAIAGLLRRPRRRPPRFAPAGCPLPG